MLDANLTLSSVWSRKTGTYGWALSLAFGAVCCVLGWSQLAGADEKGMEEKRAVEVGLQAGMWLDQKTAPLARGLLPEEILKHYESDEYRNEVVDWPVNKGTMGPEFDAATAQNAKTLGLNPAGGIIDARSGEQPPYVYGTPFPDVNASDPRAAVKIVWNMFYNLWSNGNNHSLVGLVWLNPERVDREAAQEVFFKYYDGIPSGCRDPQNPKNLLMQFIAMTTAPADMYGTTALGWRYRNAERRDSIWAFVPALRRVRAVSPANRSDGFMGSDMSQDDGQFFDGKPEDFDWKVVGETEAFRFVDPGLVGEPTKVTLLPKGGWHPSFTEGATYGFEDPKWKGLAWAPVLMKVARRQVWIVEGVPKDRYYLYGKIQLWIDKGNWQGAYNRKFSWQGELINTGQVRGGPPGNFTGKYYSWQGLGNAGITQIAENLKMNRATVANTGPGSRAVQDWFVPLEADMFDYQTLYRFGK